MFYNLVVDGVETRVTLNKERLRFESNGTESITYNIDDVIGCEELITGWFWRTEVTRVWLIEHGPSNVLLKNYKVVSGDQRKSFQHDISEMTKEETKRPKRVLVMINPNGGNRTAMTDFRDVVEPVFRLSGMSIDIISSEYPGHLVAAAKHYDFTNTDGIVLLGGDGTYHEVLNVLMRKRQEEQGVDINDPKSSLSPLNIPLGLIPTGSKSAWSVSHTGSSDVLTAALNIVQGRTKASNVIAVYNCGKLLGFGCALFNCGRITNIVVRSDTNFRWLGRSRYTIVSVWMQLFGNPKQYVYKAKVTFYTSVTERNNNETNETEIFVADRKLTGYTSYTSDTVIYNRTFLDIMTVNGNAILDGNVKLNPYRYLVPKPSMVSSFVLFGTIRPESLRQFSKRIALGKDMDQFPNEVDFVNARGFKFELTENPDDTEPDTTIGRQRMILIDGEKYDLETSTCEIWYKEDVVQIFSSYL